MRNGCPQGVGEFVVMVLVGMMALTIVWAAVMWLVILVCRLITRSPITKNDIMRAILEPVWCSPVGWFFGACCGAIIKSILQTGVK